MGKLNRIEKTLFEIKRVLLENENIRKLLFNDGEDALRQPTPAVNEVDNYIVLDPVYEAKDCSKGVFVNIIIESGNAQEDNIIFGTIRINIAANRGVWFIENGVRILRLGDEIINILEQCKFSISNNITFDSFSTLIIDKDLYGYTLSFDFSDGVGNIEY